jgi:hypothetical protein
LKTYATLFALVMAIASIPASADAILLHQYVFDGNVNDQVGTANGTLEGGATASGGVLALNGSSSFVQFASFIVPQTGSYSISLFAQDEGAGQPPPSDSGCCAEFISQGGSGDNGAFYLGLIYPTIRASDSWSNTGVAEPTDGLWHDYTLVVDATGNDSELFVDGALKATLGFAIITDATGTNTRLGEQYCSPQPGCVESFLGNEANVQIYSGALTADQVAAIAAEGPTPSTPEPSTLLLMGTGLMAVARRLRRRPPSD